MKVLAYAGTEPLGEYTKMNFEELRDRKLKIVTTQFIRYENGTSDGSKQSAVFNSATKAIIIRGWTGASSGSFFCIKVGSNPTATYQDIPMLPMRPGSEAGDIFTFNVNSGDKIAGMWLNSGSTECRLHIIELG